MMDAQELDRSISPACQPPASGYAESSATRHCEWVLALTTCVGRAANHAMAAAVWWS
ncbi:MAG: hypothetical protein QOI10_4187 [Solirubrobacterales bacterium]|jgi:hypothetical protein|nr:hypothetical protein [Solirubrobacterales bacterium]